MWHKLSIAACVPMCLQPIYRYVLRCRTNHRLSSVALKNWPRSWQRNWQRSRQRSRQWSWTTTQASRRNSILVPINYWSDAVRNHHQQRWINGAAEPIHRLKVEGLIVKIILDVFDQLKLIWIILNANWQIILRRKWWGSRWLANNVG